MINLTTADSRTKYKLRAKTGYPRYYSFWPRNIIVYPQLPNPDFSVFDLTPEGKKEFVRLLDTYPPGAFRDRLVYGKWVESPDDPEEVRC